MMQVQSGREVILVVPLAIASYADEVFWRIEAADGSVILAEEALEAGDILEGQVALTIPGSLNTLANGEAKALRRVVLRYRSYDETANVWLEAEAAYRISGLQDLVTQGNSFMTYGEALLLSADLTGLAGFEAAGKSERLAALAEAWETLVRLRYDLDLTHDRFSYVSDFPGQSPGDLSLVSAASYLLMDPRFVRATRRAQLLEADWLLSKGSDPREQGLVSKKVGESTDVFRETGSSQTKGVSVSRRALQALSGWVSHSLRLTRS